MIVLSSAEPGRPMGWQMPSRWQAAWNGRAVPWSAWNTTPGTWPPRTAIAMASAP
jgi:hypothetical protein